MIKHESSIARNLIINESRQTNFFLFLLEPWWSDYRRGPATLPLPPLVIPFLSITEGVTGPQFAFHYTQQLLSSAHFGPTHLPVPENYYSRHRGCFRLGFHPPVPLRFTRVTRKKGGKSEGSGGGFGWKVSLQFNFYDAPCHFYPSFCNGMQPISLSLSLFVYSSFSFSPSFTYHTWYLTLCSFERITIVEHSTIF